LRLPRQIARFRLHSNRVTPEPVHAPHDVRRVVGEALRPNWCSCRSEIRCRMIHNGTANVGIRLSGIESIEAHCAALSPASAPREELLVRIPVAKAPTKS